MKSKLFFTILSVGLAFSSFSTPPDPVPQCELKQEVNSTIISGITFEVYQLATIEEFAFISEPLAVVNPSIDTSVPKTKDCAQEAAICSYRYKPVPILGFKKFNAIKNSESAKENANLKLDKLLLCQNLSFLKILNC